MADLFSLLLSGAGTALDVMGKIEAGKGAQKGAVRAVEGANIQNEVYGLNVDIAKSNTELLRTQAEQARVGADFATGLGAAHVDIARARGRLIESRVVDEGRKVMATQRVFFAGRNVESGYGSPLLVMAKSAGQVQADVDLVRASTEVEVADITAKTAQLRADALSRAANFEGAAVGAAGQGVTAIGNSLTTLINARSAIERGESAALASIYGAGTALLKGAGSMWSSVENTVASAATGGA